MAAPDTEALKRNYERAKAFGSRIESLNNRLRTLVTVRESLAKSEGLIKGNPGFADAVSAEYNAVKEELAKMDELFGRRQDGLTSRINGYRSVLMASGSLTDQEEKSFSDAGVALEEADKVTSAFLEGNWARYVNKLKEINLAADAVILK